MELDSQQSLVLNYNSKNALNVIAGAGSGKTTTIIAKIIKMINEDNCYPNEFFITTFTRNASLELIKRLNQYLDINIINQMTIGTFHKIAFQTLNKYNINNQSKVQSFDRLLGEYLNLIKSSDYTDIHNYIFIDEYQDIDEMQYLIIKQLYYRTNNPNKLLVVIGDDQQNIYTFRGSNIKYILNFCLEFNGDILKLETNYRCFKAIVIVSNYLLKYNTDKIDKIFISSKTDQKRITLTLIEECYYKRNIEIANKIFNRLMQLKLKKIKLNQIAVLCRTKHILLILENILAINNISTTYLETIDDTKYYNENNENNRLVLTTIHGTKGLEFKHIIFVDYQPKENETIQEERRLYYVAITRAILSLEIIIINQPSIFLSEIFSECYDNNNIFENFNINFKLTNNVDVELIEEVNVISVTNYISHLNWINILKFNTIINFIDVKFSSNNVHQIIKKLLTNNFSKNQLITNYQYLVGIIVENFITYFICMENNLVLTDLFDAILCSNNNIINIKKNKHNYEKLILKFYNINNDHINLYDHYVINKEYYNNLNLIKNNIVSFEASESKYFKLFIDKVIKSFINLITLKNKKPNNELLNDIINYSINSCIIKERRYGLQTLKINKFIKLFDELFESKSIPFKNTTNIFNFNYKNIEIQKRISYINKKGLSIIGIIDIYLEYDNTFLVIDIKATKNKQPECNHLIQILIYSLIIMVNTNKQFNKVSIYSVLYGCVYDWNFNININEAIDFLDLISL